MADTDSTILPHDQELSTSEHPDEDSGIKSKTTTGADAINNDDTSKTSLGNLGEGELKVVISPPDPIPPTTTSRKRQASKSSSTLKKELASASKAGPKKRKVSEDPEGTTTTTTRKRATGLAAAKKNATGPGRKKALAKNLKRARLDDSESESSSSESETTTSDDNEIIQPKPTKNNGGGGGRAKQIPKETTFVKSTGVCFCDKPTSQSRMIACDECNKWFHANCLGHTDSDCDIIETFICPQCEPALRSCTDRPKKTTWKSLCRLPGCPNTARMSNDPVGPDDSIPVGSKYCSDQCGVLFFALCIGKSGAAARLYREKAVGSAEEEESIRVPAAYGGLENVSTNFLTLDEAQNIRKAASYVTPDHSSDSDSSRTTADGRSPPPQPPIPAVAPIQKGTTRIRGEPLRAEHLRAIIDYTGANLESFCHLGEHPSLSLAHLSQRRPSSPKVADTEAAIAPPPDTEAAIAALESESKPEAEVDPPSKSVSESPIFSRSEQKRLARLAKQEATLHAQQTQLLERLKFITLCRTNVAIYNTYIEGPISAESAAAAAAAPVAKPTRGRAPNTRFKEVCGFDTRLTWNDGDWWRWWSIGGRPELPTDPEKNGNGSSDLGQESSSTPSSSKPTDSSTPESRQSDISPFICILKRCDKHKQWQNLHMQDVKLDLSNCSEALDRIEGGKVEVRNCAVLRSRQRQEPMVVLL